MPSRVWLAVAFAFAFGPSHAHADTSSEVLMVTLDQAKIAKLPAGTTTLIIGNPMIADVTMLKTNNAMVITGKGFGQTNLIAIDAQGSIVEEKQVQVLPARTVVVLQNGTSRVSYACNPDCMPTVQLGDDDKTFKDAGDQISTRNGYASGAGAPPRNSLTQGGAELRRGGSGFRRRRRSPRRQFHAPEALRDGRASRGPQRRPGPGPNRRKPWRRSREWRRAGPERRQDRNLSLTAMMDERAQPPLRFGDRAAVAGPVNPFVTAAELLERGHVGAHRPVGRRDDRRRPGHHMVAGEQRLLLEERKAQMVRAVTRESRQPRS